MQHECKADTLTWFPKHLTMPTATALDMAVAGVQDIGNALNNPLLPHTMPLEEPKTKTLEALSEIFRRQSPATSDTTLPVTPLTTPAPVLRVEPTQPTYHIQTRFKKCQAGCTNKYKANFSRLDLQQLSDHVINWITDKLEIDHGGMSLKAVNPDTNELADYKEL
jgi:hypothetical protein